MHLHFIHGIVEEWSPSSQSDRLYVPAAAFSAFLRERKRYTNWGSRAGDFLSVDDGTIAGFNACLEARRLGHEVTFFINPYNIETQRPYFFTILDAAIDKRTTNTIHYLGRTFNLRKRAELWVFRNAVKAAAMLQDSDVAEQCAHTIAEQLGCSTLSLPSHTFPVSIAEIRTLIDVGVRIESHGWSHVDISAMDNSMFTDHIVRSRKWMLQNVRVDSSLYAAPFGKTDLCTTQEAIVGGTYFLADRERPAGPVSDRGWNRVDITRKLQRADQ